MVRNSLFITLLSLCGSILGFLVQLIIAQYFGLSSKVDAYFFSLSVPTFIAGMASAMMSFAVIPRLVNCEKDATYHRRYIASFLIGVTPIAFILMGILANTLGKWQIYSLPPESPIREYGNLQLLIFLAYLIGGFQIVQACLTTILNSVKFYILASIISFLSYFGIIISLYTFGTSLGILSIPVGMLLGLITSILTQVYVLRLQLFPLPVLSSLLWTELFQLIQDTPFTVLAMSCFSSYAIVDAYWAPHAGVGALATLSYVQRLIIGFGNLAVAGPSVIVVPNMAEFVRDNDYKSFRFFFLRALIFVGGIASSLALVLYFFSDKLIKLLFARGEFGHEEVVIVSATLRHMIPGMVMMLMSVIGFRALFCLRNSERVAAVLGFMWTILYFLLSYLLHTQGAIGIATGYSVVWTILFIILMITIFGAGQLKDES